MHTKIRGIQHSSILLVLSFPTARARALSILDSLSTGRSMVHGFEVSNLYFCITIFVLKFLYINTSLPLLIKSRMIDTRTCIFVDCIRVYLWTCIRICICTGERIPFVFHFPILARVLAQNFSKFDFILVTFCVCSFRMDSPVQNDHLFDPLPDWSSQGYRITGSLYFLSGWRLAFVPTQDTCKARLFR